MSVSNYRPRVITTKSVRGRDVRRVFDRFSVGPLKVRVAGRRIVTQCRNSAVRSIFSKSATRLFVAERFTRIYIYATDGRRFSYDFWFSRQQEKKQIRRFPRRDNNETHVAVPFPHNHAAKTHIFRTSKLHGRVCFFFLTTRLCRAQYTGRQSPCART